MKDWFQGRGVDERPGGPILPWWLWALLIVGIVVLLAGCGTGNGVYAIEPIGEASIALARAAK